MHGRVVKGGLRLVRNVKFYLRFLHDKTERQTDGQIDRQIDRQRQKHYPPPGSQALINPTY